MEHHSKRKDRVTEATRQALSPLLQDMMPLGSLVTLVRVELDSKLMFCRAFVSVLPEQIEADRVRELNEASPRLRHALGERLNMSRVPELRFVADKTTDTLSSATDISSKERVE